MKIVYICNEYPPSSHGGIGIVVKILAERFAKENNLETYVVGYDESVDSDQLNIENGVTVLRIKPRLNVKNKNIVNAVLKNFIIRLYLSCRIYRFCKNIRADIVESFDWWGPLLFRPYCKRLVVKLHGANSAYQYYEGKKSSKLLYYFEKKQLKLADKIVAVSGFIGETSLSALKETSLKYEVAYNSVNIHKFRETNIKRDYNKILYVGRIYYRKGLTELFQALNLFFETNTNAYIELVGNPNVKYEAELLNLLKPEFHQQVIFKGKVPYEDLPDIYSSAAFSVVPSKAEAFGLVAIESMACKTPVLMCDGASGPEIIDRDKNGFLVNIYDMEEFANTLQRLLSGGVTQEIRDYARKTVENKFSDEKSFQSHKQIYDLL